jgi:F0F1-type ATP synthase membrane subunit b/b'
MSFLHGVIDWRRAGRIGRHFLRTEIRERAQIRYQGEREVLKDAEGVYIDAGTKAKEIIEEAKHQAKELKTEADRHLSEAQRKVKEILARVEK